MKSKKLLISAAIISILVGSLCIGLGLAMGGSFHDMRISMGFNEDGFEFAQYEDIKTEDLTITDIDSLTIFISMGDIRVVEGDQTDIRVLNVLENRYELDINEKEAVLDLKSDTSFHIFNFGNSEKQDVTVVVPKGFLFEHLEIHNSMGDMDLQDVDTKMLHLEANMGNIEGHNIKSEGLSVENDMGDIELEGLFLNHSVIHDSMGDIDIRIFDNIKNYSYEADCSMGSVKVNGEKGKNSQIASTDNDIQIHNSMGDITLDFD